MLKPILLGLLLGSGCMMIHALGTTWWLRHVSRRTDQRQASRESAHNGFLQTLGLLGGSITLLTILHVIEILAWALTYHLHSGINLLADMEEALYFSFVTFTTVGYGDIVIEPGWRLMAGIEALNGIMLLGWSTAILMYVASRVKVLQK